MTPHEKACETARALAPEQWVALHVPRYARAVGAYEKYAAFLQEVLRAACRVCAPLAVVEARCKTIPSFAEKILRKREHYLDPAIPLPPDPLLRLTDLCGARVICQTASQVEQVCRFVERAFVIDRANSEDVRRRLKTSEFGYRSVHYIVECDPVRLASSGIVMPIPEEVLGSAFKLPGSDAAGVPLRAEIQVRTFLEHASSNLGHDGIYKTEFKVPERIKRDYASVAAVLEGADQDMERIVAALEGFRSNFGAWHSREEVEREIRHAQVLLGLPDDSMKLSAKIPVAVRAAQLAIAIGQHHEGLEILRPFADGDHAGVHRVLGQARVELRWAEPTHAEFSDGRKHLEKAAQLTPGDAETLGLLADCANRAGEATRAREHFSAALAVDGVEPITLVRYLEFESAAAGHDHLLRLAGPMLRGALTRARQQIETRSNLASAWSAKTVAHLFLREPNEALHALAQVARLCAGPSPATPAAQSIPCVCAAGRALLRLRETVRHLDELRAHLPGFDAFERFLLLLLAVRIPDSAALEQLSSLPSWHGQSAPDLRPHFCPERPVVILAGACTPVLEERVSAFGAELAIACHGLSFDLVSGGTTSGISGVAGGLAAASEGRIRAYGYLPGRLPRGNIQEDTRRFTRGFSAAGSTDFTPLDPLQGWTDLICAGLDPACVRLVCYAPGSIANVECAVALALGARVGVVVDAELPGNRQFDPIPWEGCPRLLFLPKDAMTLRAYLQLDDRPLAEEERKRLEPAARLAHLDYVRSARPREDPSLQPWESLPDSLQLSNYHQVVYWEKMLKEYGFRVRPLTEAERREPDRPLLVMREALPRPDGIDLIETLAQREHGRWNVERLARGWRYAREKDVARKLSPWLIPWKEVPRQVQLFDVIAIEELPKKLREAGLELERL